MRLASLAHSLLSTTGIVALAAASTDSAQRPFVALSSPPSAPPYRISLLALHKALIEESSTSGAEGDIGEWLVDYLAARNYTVVKQPVPRQDNLSLANRSNVLAWPVAGAGAVALWSDVERGVVLPSPLPRLLVTSHIDVVPPHIPYSIDVGENGVVTAETVIRGRGSVDAKASVAAQITALEVARQERPNQPTPDAMLLFVVGEEDSGDGMKAFSAYMQSRTVVSATTTTETDWFKAVVFGEPTENRLACGHKGILGCELAATGRAGHSGYPWLGLSATELLVRGLSAVLDADLGYSTVFGNTTVNIGVLAGGVAANVIPAAAAARLAVRVALGPQATGHEKVRARIVEALAGAVPAGASADALALHCTHGYGVVDCQCKGVPGFEGDGATITVNYGTDVPNLAGNHARYLYGPGDILVAHGDGEAITVGVLEAAVVGYGALFRHVLGTPAGVPVVM